MNINLYKEIYFVKQGDERCIIEYDNNKNRICDINIIRQLANSNFVEKAKLEILKLKYESRIKKV